MSDIAISALPAQSPVASSDLLPIVESGATKKATVADVVKGGGALLADGSVAATANLPMGSHKITGLQNGATGTQEAPSVAQVEALIAASVSNVADWKQSVRAATTANITLSGAQTIDGVSVIAGDRVLVKNQTTASQNGLYVCASGAWARATDADVSSEVTCGLTVLVEEGTIAAGKPYILTTANPITLGTTALTFTPLSSATADGTTLSLSGGVMSIAALGVGTSQLAANAVTFAKLLNATAADKVIGSDGAGNFKELSFGGSGLERSGTQIQVASQLPARTTENVVIDLYPSMVSNGTFTSAAPVNFDYAIGTGKHYDITAKVYVDNGSGTGACLYVKKLNVSAHQTGGAAVILDQVIVSAPLEGGSYSFTATVSGTNVRFTLTKTNGGTDSYNLVAGDFHLDKP